MLKRSITGLLLGLIMISGLLFSIWSATALLLVIHIFSSLEWNQHFVKREGSFASRNYIFISLFFIFFILFKLFIPDTDHSQTDIQKLNGILVFILSTFGTALIAKQNWSFTQSWYSGIFYIGFPILICFSYLHLNFNDHKWIILGLIIMNWSNDVFAYFTGRLFGRHSLAPDISPKKTIEGAIGGMLATILSAYLINIYLFNIPFATLTICILGLSVWLAGTLGDLYESKMKRIIGIKDSGHVLPGHGGFLDRFDSFFFVIPVGIFVLSF
jgi:phosphatidate cytidylyltransferase